MSAIDYHPSAYSYLICGLDSYYVSLVIPSMNTLVVSYCCFHVCLITLVISYCYFHVCLITLRNNR